jgi:hypothetical protein
VVAKHDTGCQERGRILVLMKLQFDSRAYGKEVAGILAIDQDGQRLIPLVSAACSSQQARSLLKQQKAQDLFSRGRAAEAALGGLFLYFSCGQDGHEIVQNVESAEGSFWHAIVHRQEPDAGNSAYWFRQTGPHPVFEKLAGAAEEIAGQYPGAKIRRGPAWDPFWFIEFCEKARLQPGSAAENAALEIQRAEWQLLFDYCARVQT